MAERGAGTAAAKPEEPASAAFAASAFGSAANWRQTLWAMVAIQFVMAMAISVLTPIMPLFLPELGVASPSGIDLGRHPRPAAPRSSPPSPRRSGGGCPTGTAAN